MQASEPAAYAISDSDRQRSHWLRLRLWTLALLLLWALVSFGLTWHARALSFFFFGWPFSYWLAAQGSLLIFLAIVGFYARVANRLDVEHGLDEED